MNKNESTAAEYRRINKAMKKKYARQRCEYDADGRAIINMTVKDDSEFLSSYSEHDTPVISTEVAEFIENSTHSLRPMQPISLHIHSNCIDEDEKVDYQNAIREYYAEKYIASKRESRFNLTAVLLLMLAGIATLVLAFQIDNHIWSEVIDIAAWVFLWEAVDIGFFKSREINLKRKRYMSYMTMTVKYLPLHTEEHSASPSLI